MADFIKLNVKNGGEIYVSKFAITYLAKEKEGGTFICFSSPQNEEHNHLIVTEVIEDVLNKFSNK